MCLFINIKQKEWIEDIRRKPKAYSAPLDLGSREFQEIRKGSVAANQQRA